MGIIAGAIVLIGIIKASIIGFYPSEAPMLFGSMIFGVVLGYISTKIKTEDEEEDEDLM